ncbi:glycosyltransferase family 2 protein [Blastococcus sp. TF02A-30]|uniref:glycosyltransferase n=1 Tax=Blastococcus sp. TF02A-30 TaxID=2250580 RepID=UPI000DE84582|nr:glycosyltransferase family 2 protein [Blastococcus sp. TF02A-30]RBY89329.1 glycosyltransferase family 2 protein [Blastococcus sp. TF02A-30]
MNDVLAASPDIAEIGRGVLVGVLLLFVAFGAIPVIAGLAQFLVIPVHAVRNHYRETGPYLPNVAVLVPAWNEAAVLPASVERLMGLDYPPDRLRVYVVDDASTDDTPAVMAGLAERFPGRVVHLRREKGGEGKAHTLNHGLREVLADDWMEALLIMDADVIYAPESLRKMTRHLADPTVGAVTAYIREGSRNPEGLTRFIGFDYLAAQAASRRAQNVAGAMACLAGGAQLHTRENLLAIGGQIDTSSLAEDTVTTFRTQLAGHRVVFEPHARVLAEEPAGIDALWKQRLRWARGNVQITSMYRHLFFRKSVHPGLGGFFFGMFWFAILLLPLAMLMVSVGLIGLHLLDSELASDVFGAAAFVPVATFVFMVTLTLSMDPAVGRTVWREALLFPGLISFLVLLGATFPMLVPFDGAANTGWTLFVYSWLVLCIPMAFAVRKLETTRWGRRLAPIGLYLVGFGPMMCAITVDAYLKEYRGAAMTWDKTEKTGRVMA